MAGLLVQLTSLLFFFCLGANLLLWIYSWQAQEYSVKRLFIYFKETKSGRNLFLGWAGLSKWVLIGLYLITIFFSGYDFAYHVVIFLFYLIFSLTLLKKIIDKNYPLPSISLAVIVVFIFSIIIEAVLFVFPPLDQFLWILLLDKLGPILVAIFLMIFAVLFDFSSDVTINRALSKIEARPDLLSIAVVGSYGRGSTKEFISKVLATKFNVLETKKSFNDQLGIAKTILSGLTRNKKIFIAEMDDHSIQDIREMANIVKPKICVVCGINEQKLSEFGSIEKISEAKYEVVDSLSRDGIAMFNINNLNSEKLYKKTKIKKFSFSVANESDIEAFNVKLLRFSLSFDVKVFGKKYKLSGIRLLGRQNIENLLPAIFIALYMGIDFSKIKKTLLSLRPLAATMNPWKSPSGAIFIDDTYNANINSVLRALAYLKIYRGKKIMVLEPLTGLGRHTSSAHEKFGVSIGKVCDVLLLTNGNDLRSIERGIRKSGKKCQVYVQNTKKTVEYIKNNCKRSDVVLFEGIEASNSFSLLKKEEIYKNLN